MLLAEIQKPTSLAITATAQQKPCFGQANLIGKRKDRIEALMALQTRKLKTESARLITETGI